ncbi:hypothetical protein DdX_15012 [Ditylenchus destructor]|uniref:Uncharacterized protein n=1 Tax=Ditylenchus destructor TaxID=166010 RepID=A0AAD4MR61_9BILA|nr:hypothetical protein DdX_15012 [Ditylenchus destructor]
MICIISKVGSLFVRNIPRPIAPNRNKILLIDVVANFTRDELERYIQLTCRLLNQIVIRHFPYKPFRVLDYLLYIRPNRYLETVGLKEGSQWLHDGAPALNAVTGKWVTTKGCSFNSLENMRPFLVKSVRVSRMNVFLPANYEFTQDYVAALKSIAHVWEGAKMEFSIVQHVESNLGSYTRLIENQDFLRCSHLKCCDEILKISLQIYPSIYKLDVLEVSCFSPEAHKNMEHMIEVVEGQVHYPNSKTIFVLTETKLNDELLVTKVFEQHMRKKFSTSVAPQKFQIVFKISAPSLIVTFNEYHIENHHTKEILELEYIQDADYLEYYILHRFPM